MQCKKEEIRTHASIKNREEQKEEGGVEERERWGLGVDPGRVAYQEWGIGKGIIYLACSLHFCHP